jgi:hypothetical protein
MLAGRPWPKPGPLTTIEKEPRIMVDLQDTTPATDSELSDDTRYILIAQEMLRRGRATIDEAKAVNDPTRLMTPDSRLIFIGLASVALVTDALASIPISEVRAMSLEELQAAGALIGASEMDGIVLGARILLREAWEFVAEDDWITWSDIRSAREESNERIRSW